MSSYISTHLPSSGSTVPYSDLEIAQDEGYYSTMDGKMKDTSGRQSKRTSEDSMSENRTEVGDGVVGLEILGRDSKELLQGIQNLRHLGVEEFVVPLPKIVVVGGQSTGKSSLIEGMSEIKVPRSAGTCTRCPLEINITESNGPEDPWLCKVSLVKKYVYEGHLDTPRLADAPRTKLLGPWTTQKLQDFPFATVSSKEKVQDVLYWAQLATLNPGNDWETYKPGRNHATLDTIQVKFSPNVVRIDISGPGLPNLSFYDLPGVINNAEFGEEDYLVQLVKNLVKQYIHADNCIVLLAVPMTDDAANSSAAAIIKAVPGAQKRTLGVLTKPDRVQAGEDVREWTSILSGHRFKLGFGYYMVKNNPDPTVSHATARKEEAEFFRTVEPYATQLVGYEHRFGTLNLQTALSRQLTAQIRSGLPAYTDHVKDKIASVERDLKGLPEPPAGNLPILIYTRIGAFARDLQNHLDGGSHEFPFRKTWHAKARKLRNDLLQTKPVLVLPTAPRPNFAEPTTEEVFTSSPRVSTPTAVKKTTDAILIDSDDGAGPCTPSPRRAPHGKKRLTDSSGSVNRSKRVRRMEDIPLYSADKVGAQRFRFDEIRDIITAVYVGLPFQTDSKAIERMNQLSMQHWEPLMSAFLDQTQSLCQDLISERLVQSFNSWRQTPLYNRITSICDEFFLKAMAEQRKAALRNYEMEHQETMTFNEEALAQAQEEALSTLQLARQSNRAVAFVNELEAQNGKLFSEPVRKDKIAKVTPAQLGPDPYNQELQAMATVRGYYTCAYSRFLDNICQSIRCELFHKCRNELLGALVRELGLEHPDADERCALLLAVDPRVEERRIELKKEQESLTKALAWLESRSRHSLTEEDGRASGIS